jgi:hypothetical protein
VAVFDVICESITRLQADAATFLDVIVVLSNLTWPMREQRHDERKDAQRSLRGDGAPRNETRE